MADLTPRPGHETTQARHKVGSESSAVQRVGVRGSAAECRFPGKLGIQVVRRVGDELYRVLVTGLGAVAPADDAVAGQHHAFDAGIGLHIITELDAERVARTLPRKPANAAAPDLFRRSLTIRRRGQSDDCI